MVRNLSLAAALTSLVWLPTAMALGLGEIEVTSRLNQPLTASIPVSGSGGEIESLAVRLANNEAFQRAGIVHGAQRLPAPEPALPRDHSLVLCITDTPEAGVWTRSAKKFFPLHP